MSIFIGKGNEIVEWKLAALYCLCTKSHIHPEPYLLENNTNKQNTGSNVLHFLRAERQQISSTMTTKSQLFCVFTWWLWESFFAGNFFHRTFTFTASSRACPFYIHITLILFHRDWVVKMSVVYAYVHVYVFQLIFLSPEEKNMSVHKFSYMYCIMLRIHMHIFAHIGGYKHTLFK